MGLSKQQIRNLVMADVQNVQREAYSVINISSDGIATENLNDQWRLGVIAVVGPTQAFGECFSEAVLCEIGLGKSRPYHEANKPKLKLLQGEPKSIPKRKKWFQLSESQYLAVLPFLFRRMREITDAKCWARKCHPDNPFLVPTPRNYYSHREKILHESESLRPAISGTRFSVSKKDLLLRSYINHVYFTSKKLKERLGGLARFIDKRLKSYRINGHKKQFCELPGAIQIKEMVETRKKSLPPYLLTEMLHWHLPKGKKNVYFYHLCNLFGLDGEEAKHRNIMNESLPDAKHRLDEVDLRIIRKNPKEDYIVFELFPSSEPPSSFSVEVSASE
jgi:hypothetical protein